jgi:hypothetical protein
MLYKFILEQLGKTFFATSLAYCMKISNYIVAGRFDEEYFLTDVLLTNICWQMFC